MLTLNDFRRIFEEKGISYEDETSYIAIENPTLGDEEVPAVVIIACDESILDIQCFLPKYYSMKLNDKISATLNDLNRRFRFFQITLVEAEDEKDKYRLSMMHSVFIDYLSDDPNVAYEMTVRALEVMDVVYAEIMKAKYSS